MKFTNFFELTFIFLAGFAMPFIVIGSYFNFVAKSDRHKPLTICFLVISVLYAMAYAYFAWQALKNSDNWKRLVKE